VSAMPAAAIDDNAALTHPDTAHRYRELRALHTGAVAGWYEYLGGDTGPAGWYLLRVGATVRRLVRGEGFWWVQGVADGHQRGQLIAALAGEALPELLTVEQAAARLPHEVGDGTMAAAGVRYHMRQGVLYPLTGPNRVQLLFAAQVDAIAATRRARVSGSRGDKAAATRANAVWRDLRAGLPPAATLEDLTAPDGYVPARVVLPVPEGVPEATRRTQALMLVHRLDLCVYSHPHPDDGAYLVLVGDGSDRTVERWVPARGVLPWALGLADRHGCGARLLYRPGL
jgi:hypothetical protein